MGQRTLDNFYAFHVALLPVILVLTLLYHFWRIRKDGGISQPAPEAGARVRYLTTLPHLVQRELAAGAAVAALLLLWAMLVPAPLGALADPTQSPNPAKAAWYFLGLQELLLHMHPLAVMVLLALVAGGLLWLPRLDGSAAQIGRYFRSPIGRRVGVLGALAALYLLPLLVLIDEALAGLVGTAAGPAGVCGHGNRAAAEHAGRAGGALRPFPVGCPADGTARGATGRSSGSARRSLCLPDDQSGRDDGHWSLFPWAQHGPDLAVLRTGGRNYDGSTPVARANCAAGP